MYDTLIIGGGAAGMFCAVHAAGRVCVVEKRERALAKLLATGNGRCNFTNVNLGPGDYFGEEPGFAAPVVTRFGAARVMERFRLMGIEPYVGGNGRVYPRSLQAASVSDALRMEAESLGVELRAGEAAARARRVMGGFEVTLAGGGLVTARRLVVAAGGLAGGGGRSGYEILQGFGHTVTPLRPALTRLLTEGGLARSLMGTKAEGVLKGYANGAPVASAEGDILFAEDGLSGDAAFALSAYYRGEAGFTAGMDFAPEYTLDELTALLAERARRLAHWPLAQFLSGFIHKKLGMALLKLAGNEKLAAPAGSLAQEGIARLAAAIKDTRLAVRGTAGFNQAQVTAGGARTREFHAGTLESRLVPGLFAAGEALDVTGPCGGYNLHWAWASGWAAAGERVRLGGCPL